jgi:hypothetical protein
MIRSRRIDAAKPEPSFGKALSRWQEEVVCLDELDPVTTEIVRLRCAQHHDCHT